MVHQYNKNGNNIVLDVGSGSVHVVDNITYDIIEVINKSETISELIDVNTIIEILENKYSEEEIRSSYDEILELFTQEKLFSNDDYKEHIPKRNIAPIKALCLHVAHDCNLRCEYCFASTGDYEGDRNLMSVSVGKKAIDFLIKNSGSRKNLEVDFFGGEPLMNLEMVKEIVEYSRELEDKYNKNFRFTMTTNGVLLTEDVRKYLDDNMDNIVLSIDGRKEINDKMRLTINNKGSYDIIIDNIKEMVKLREDRQYYVRGTFTKNNLDFSKDVIDLYNQGFKNISVEPAIADKDAPYAISDLDLPTIQKEYDKLARSLLEINKTQKNLSFFHFNIDFTGGPCVIKRLRGCGAGNEYVAITPEGDIYPCHQFVGKEEWKMGSLLNNTFNNNMKTKFSKHNIYTKDNCGDCWAKFYCSGGCLANSWQYAGGIEKSHLFSCLLEKARVETAIMLKVEEAKKLQKVSNR